MSAYDFAYTSEVRLFPYVKEVSGWLPCDGRLLPIRQYAPLFSIIQNVYGGDGKETFALPDLRWAAVDGVAEDRALGTAVGQNAVSLEADQLPAHTHSLNTFLITTPGVKVLTSATPAPAAQGYLERMFTGVTTATPGGTAVFTFVPPSSKQPVSLSPHAISNYGEASPQPHENRQPFLLFSYKICVEGEYPVPAF